MSTLLPNTPAVGAVEGEQEPASPSVTIARDAALIAAGSVAGRLLGLGRDVAKSHYYGAGSTADALAVAVRVPILLYDLFIGGMVASALVPEFVRTNERGRRHLWHLVSIVMTLAAVLFTLATAVLILFAGPIAGYMVAGAGPDTVRETTALLRLTAPSLLLLSMSGIGMAALFALKRFLFPALAAAALNAGIIAGILLLHESLGARAMALGLLAGAALQLCLQLLGLRGSGGYLHWVRDVPVYLAHPGVRRIAVLYAPIFLGLLVEILISRPLTYRLASLSGVGAIAQMEYALSLSYFPRGLVALGISSATLPLLAHYAALERNGHATASDQFAGSLAEGARLIIVWIVPACLGMIFLAEPIVALLLGHGSFQADDAAVTARALQLYLLALPVAALDSLIVYAFYARQDTVRPALTGVASVFIFLGLAVYLQPRFGLFSIMIAESMKLLIHLTILLVLLGRKYWNLRQSGITGVLGRTVAASAVMATVVWTLMSRMPEPDNSGGLFVETLIIFVPSVGGLLAYLWAAQAAGIEEVAQLLVAMKAQAARNWGHRP